MLQTGDILVGRYEVDSLLGRGGMSSVYSAFDRTLARDVAIKVLAAELVEDEVFVERFDREARAAASLSHRNVVAVFDSGVDGGARFIVMERVSGRTLSAVLKGGPLRVQRAVDIALSVAQALGAAHAHGIVHRDVKPANVMVGDGRQVKVLDFGIARALAGTSLTRATTVIGTAGYLSPEQAKGGAIDARSDLYGLGCVLYEMLTGRPPFVADSTAALVNQHVTKAPDPPSRRRPEVSAGLDEVVLRCLAKDPGERYDGAQALCVALAEVPSTTNGSAADAVAATRVPSGVRWQRPAPRLPGVSAKPRDGSARWTATPVLGRAHRRRKRRWLAAPVTLAVLVTLALLLDHGSAGRPGGATARASGVPSKHKAASEVKRAATSNRGSTTTTAGPQAAVASAPAGATGAGVAAARSRTADPAAAAGALNGLVLEDQQQGLIDGRAASVISRQTGELLDASTRDAGQAAKQLLDFGSTLDVLATRGEISSPAVAALKAAAVELMNTLMSSSGSNAEASAAGGVPATDGEEPGPAAGDKGEGHRHDGPATGPRD
ncbi:MAG TPA: protein kinase [Solirubrobacteraceae bacterium]|nr:protein kinase [Solirubrobacteraceae bacterium]